MQQVVSNTNNGLTADDIIRYCAVDGTMSACARTAQEWWWPMHWRVVMPSWNFFSYFALVRTTARTRGNRMTSSILTLTPMNRLKTRKPQTKM